MSTAIQVEEKQPKALYLLFFVQMWECFSYYGMIIQVQPVIIGRMVMKEEKKELRLLTRALLKSFLGESILASFLLIKLNLNRF